MNNNHNTINSVPTLQCQPLEPCKRNREVLLDQSVVLKNDNDVNLKLHLEVVCQQGRAGKQPREDHVQRNGHTTADITFTNLDVLDFGSVFGVPIGTPTRLNSDQLNVNGANRCICVLHHHCPSERLGDAALVRVEMVSNEEIRNALTVFDICKTLRSDGKVDWVGLICLCLLHNELHLLLQVLAEEGSLHLHDNRVLHVHKDAMISLVQRLVGLCTKRQLKGYLSHSTGYLPSSGEIQLLVEHMYGLQGIVEGFESAHTSRAELQLHSVVNRQGEPVMAELTFGVHIHNTFHDFLFLVRLAGTFQNDDQGRHFLLPSRSACCKPFPYHALIAFNSSKNGSARTTAGRM